MRSTAVHTAAAFLLSLPLALAKPVPINGFAAKVNGKVITRSELNESIKMSKMRLDQVPPSAERAKRLNSLRKDALEGLIERELVLSEFEKRGGAVKDEMIDEDINRIIRGEPFNNDRKKFLSELKKQGTTLGKFRQIQEKQIAVRYMRSSQLSDIPVATPTEIKKFYDSNPDLFRAEGFIRLRTITISKAGETGDTSAQKQLVEEVYLQLRNGGDFGTLAKAYSLDSAAAQGGDRGTIGRGTEELRPDLVALAFMQPTGEISQIHEDQGFYYIMKVESRQAGKREPLSNEKVRNAIERKLKDDKSVEALDRWLARLKKTAIIKRY
jgi:peptidyl-prolyl cis-trans isomerase SurA